MTGVDTEWLEGLEEAAGKALPAEVFDYFRAGAGGGVTTGEAHAAWQAIRFAPRVLRNVTDVDLATTVLGTELRAPIAVAPTTLQRLAHADGELAMARGCAASGSLMVVSSNAGTPFHELGGAGVSWWLQAYLTQDRSLSEPLLESAVTSGARAIVLTVDTPVVATKQGRGRDVWARLPAGVLRTNFAQPPEHLPGGTKATDLGPADIAWLSENTGLPVVVKGILRPDDARRCVDAGAAAVWVSNHGGRQLDRSISTAQALPAVSAAVGDDAQVYVDGGVRNGLDVLAGLAMGADCVFLGRLPLWALVGGEESVRAMHTALAAQLSEAMRLGGMVRPQEAHSTLVHPVEMRP